MVIASMVAVAVGAVVQPFTKNSTPTTITTTTTTTLTKPICLKALRYAVSLQQKIESNVKICASIMGGGWCRNFVNWRLLQRVKSKVLIYCFNTRQLARLHKLITQLLRPSCAAAGNTQRKTLIAINRIETRRVLNVLENNQLNFHINQPTIY